MQPGYATQLFSRVVSLFELLSSVGNRRRHTAIEYGVKNLFLTFEIEIHGAVGNTRLARDIGDL